MRYFKIEGMIEIEKDSNPEDVELIDNLIMNISSEIEKQGGFLFGSIKEVDEDGNDLIND